MSLKSSFLSMASWMILIKSTIFLELKPIEKLSQVRRIGCRSIEYSIKFIKKLRKYSLRCKEVQSKMRLSTIKALKMHIRSKELQQSSSISPTKRCWQQIEWISKKKCLHITLRISIKSTTISPKELSNSPKMSKRQQNILKIEYWMQLTLQIDLLLLTLSWMAEDRKSYKENHQEATWFPKEASTLHK